MFVETTDWYDAEECKPIAESILNLKIMENYLLQEQNSLPSQENQGLKNIKYFVSLI